VLQARKPLVCSLDLFDRRIALDPKNLIVIQHTLLPQYALTASEKYMLSNLRNAIEGLNFFGYLYLTSNGACINIELAVAIFYSTEQA
jgi:hypothetical protein